MPQASKTRNTSLMLSSLAGVGPAKLELGDTLSYTARLEASLGVLSARLALAWTCVYCLYHLINNQQPTHLLCQLRRTAKAAQ